MPIKPVASTLDGAFAQPPLIMSKMSKSKLDKVAFTKTALMSALGSIMLMSAAQAAPQVTDEERADQETVNSQNDSSEDEQLNKALDALRLKKAVENGVIDPSVLEAYQKHTINSVSNPGTTPVSPSQTPNSSNGAQSSTAQPGSSSTNHGANVDANLPMQDEYTPPALISEAELEAQASKLQQQGYQMMTPDQIEAQLANVDALMQQASQFDAPVAMLDDQSLPIGFDAELNVSKFPTPTNSQTLGIDTSDSDNALDAEIANRPIDVSTSASSGRVTNNEDLTEVNNPEAVLAQQSSNKVGAEDQDRLIAEQIKAAKQQAGAETGKTQSSSSINPDEYLPDYQASTETEAIADSVESSQGKSKRARNPGSVFKRIYNRYFNDGYEALPHIETKVYFERQGEGNAPAKLIKADEDIQPINNIKAALDDITVQSIKDFTGAVPRLRQTALNAAKAVGYYDVTLRIQRSGEDQIDVIIEKLGEPVTVDSRVIDVRGDGGETAEFQVLETNLPPQKGDVFNHGVYKASKAALETVSNDYGYFDQYWLNKSVDIILPDNTADVDLIYNTGERYQFDEVVFFTYDAEKNELTTDPNKLPVKPELLRQLLGFNAGDPYYRPKVTKLTNDLSATRYFNTVNVETIMPAEAGDNATLGFDRSSTSSDSAEEDEDVRVTAEGTTAKEPRNKAGNILPVAANGNNAINNDSSEREGTASLSAEQSAGGSGQTVLEADIAPIDFQVDEQTRDKLQAIKLKAQRLASLPDDRVLDEKSQESKNLLGKISDSISNIAEKIFPDDKNSDEPLKPEKLSGRATPEQVKQSKKIPLYVYVASDKPRDAQVGIGYGSDTGVRATAKVDYNLINRDGYQAGFEVAASRINKNATLYASRPWKHPLDDTLNAKLSYEEELIDQGEGNFELSTKTLQAAGSRNIHSDSGWDRTYSLRYRMDKLDTNLDETKWEELPVRFKSSSPTQQALLLGYGLSKLNVDNISNPTMGYRQYYGIEAGAEGALTDTNMAIARAGVRGIYTFGEDKKHQVLGKLDAGYIWADDFYDVPYKLRFFAGGDQSIRGFDYNSLSPIENGYLTGGQVLAVGSAEYNYEFKPGFRAALFTDVGNAYDTKFEADTKVGVGVGVRWASPIGVVRLDVAAGVTEESIPVRLHFFIGSPL